MKPSIRPFSPSRALPSGFTLVELMITLTVLAVVMVVLTAIMFTAARSKTQTSNRIESSQAGRVAVDMIARDIRSAGYGADLDEVAPQPPFAYVDSMQILINANLNPYPDTSSKHLPPLAYDPTGAVKPFPLNGTSWTPPMKYKTGAELVRWTLDVNNDGLVNGSDLTDINGLDAQRTPNPNDYTLVRQVYGDSAGTPATAGNNQWPTEKVALIRKPGGTVPPLFTVYVKDAAGTLSIWNWANGAVPASRLQDIERVEIRVVAPSGKADFRGKYAETTIQTEVYGIRNVPDFGAKEYKVDGYVFDDKNGNGVWDAGTDVGLANCMVTLGNLLSTTTSSGGYFSFNASSGTYTLRHYPLQNYKVKTSPDSFVVTVGPAVTRSFVDSMMVGGWVNTTVFEDLDGDRIHDPGEPYRAYAGLTISPLNHTEYSNTSGTAALFAQTGPYTVALSVPDSFVCTTANPFSGTMTAGGSSSALFALSRQLPGTVQGQVWQDKNSNGVMNSGEGPVAQAWVGITTAGGTVITYGHTDSYGNYSLDVPANDPPHTQPYAIECIPPAGFYPTTSTELGPTWVQSAQTITGKNFGVNNFQQITLNSTRVLSLASGDLIEKDWSGSHTEDARQDADLVLGADNAGSDQVSVWFNQYNSSSLFTDNRTYSRSAPNSVLAIAVDSLSEDAAPFSARMDLVTGTTLAGAGNFFVWYTQGTSSNEGYIPVSYSLAYRTSDNGDVQAVTTGNILGSARSDILVGTKSPTVGRGTLEIWRGSGTVTPTFSQTEVYPPRGNIPGGVLGEVTCLALKDLRGIGTRDLVVGTKTGTYSGQILFMSGKGGGGGTFRACQVKTLSGQAVTALTCCDYDLDGKVDVVVAEQTGTNTGKIELWKNMSPTTGDSLIFTLDQSETTDGIPISVASGDFGGAPNPDFVVGYRDDPSSYTGRCEIFYMDGGTLPPDPLDPSGGTVTGMVPAITINNFNYGTKPSLPSPPYLTDIAIGVKTGPTTGALVLFVR